MKMAQKNLKSKLSFALATVITVSVGAVPQTSLAGGFGEGLRAGAQGADDAARAARIVQWANKNKEAYYNLINLAREARRTAKSYQLNNDIGMAAESSIAAYELETEALALGFKIRGAIESQAFRGSLTSEIAQKLDVIRHQESTGPVAMIHARIRETLKTDHSLSQFQLTDAELTEITDKLMSFDYNGLKADEIVASHLEATLLFRASKQPKGYTVSLYHGVYEDELAGFLRELEKVTGKPVKYDPSHHEMLPPHFTFHIQVNNPGEAHKLVQFLEQNDIQVKRMIPTQAHEAEIAAQANAVKAAQRADLNQQARELEDKLAAVRRQLNNVSGNAQGQSSTRRVSIEGDMGTQNLGKEMGGIETKGGDAR